MARVWPQRHWVGDTALSGGQIKKLLITQFLPLLHMKYITNTTPDGTKGRFTHSMPFPCHAMPLRV